MPALAPERLSHSQAPSWPTAEAGQPKTVGCVWLAGSVPSEVRLRPRACAGKAGSAQRGLNLTRIQVGNCEMLQGTPCGGEVRRRVEANPGFLGIKKMGVLN